MKQTKFKVEFIKRTFIEVMAFDLKQAKILAQAKRIEQGMDYEIVNIFAC